VQSGSKQRRARFATGANASERNIKTLVRGVLGELVKEVLAQYVMLNHKGLVALPDFFNFGER
jgi:hypothetical protein